MSEFTSAITWPSVALSVAQFLIGVAIGWWFKKRRAVGVLGDEQKLRAFVIQVYDYCLGLADDASRHASRVDEVCQEFVKPKSAHSHATPESLIVDAVSQIVLANKRFQTKLHSVEHELRQHSHLIDLHLNQTRIDPLTELPNRRAFDEQVRHRFADRQSSGKSFAIMLVDLDQFHKINEQFGHSAGDRVLRHVRDVLTDALREQDVITRYEGDQFAVVLPETAVAEAARAAERVRRAIHERQCPWEERSLSVTVSVGVVEAAAQDDAGALFRRVDTALYAAKESGRNMGYFHDGHDCHPILEDTLSSLEAPDRVPRSKAAAYAQYVAALGVDARTDPLTGLPNRRAFGDELRRQIAVARQSSAPLALMIVGVDRLSLLGAYHGQDTVDQLLRKMGQILCAAVRDADLVTRYGWEEFAVILPKTNLLEANRAHDRIERALAACAHDEIPLTVSIGIVALQDEEDSLTLAKRADAAFHLTKQDRLDHAAAAEPTASGVAE